MTSIPEVRPKSVRELIDHNLLVRERSAPEILDRFRNSLVVRALKLSKGNRTHAARLLQISDKTFHHWMREANISTNLEENFWRDE